MNHTFGPACPTCQTACVHTRYSRLLRRSAWLHRESLRPALLDPRAAAHELARFWKEFVTLPPGHSGWCQGECPSELAAMGRGMLAYPCAECRDLRSRVQWVDVAEARIGRTRPAHAPAPSALLLDLIGVGDMAA